MTGSKTLEHLEPFWIKECSQVPQAFISCITGDFSVMLSKGGANNSGDDLISIWLPMQLFFFFFFSFVIFLFSFFTTSVILNTYLHPNCIFMLCHFIQITFEQLHLAYYLTCSI